MKKIGIFGGTFDPVHLSHLEFAEIAIDELHLDKVLFIPSAVPPHKSGVNVVSFEHRVKMLEIACRSIPAFECCTIEGSMPKPSYSVDTIKALLSQFDKGHILYFMIGCDAFIDILSWKSYKEILNLVSPVVSKRMGSDETKLPELAMNLGYDTRQQGIWSGMDQKKNIYFLEKTPVDISSTLIKKNIGDEKFLMKTLPRKVFEYIEKNRLYFTRNKL